MMRRALFHAARSQGTTTPNPMVGAVVVSRDGVVVGQGRHVRAGAAHAEVAALDEAGDRARGATLYVTLEPCCHHGRTPPCTARIRRAGIARVVAAMTDPNPLVKGRGLQELHDAGIGVETGVLGRDAERLNQAFIILQAEGRPLVIAKAAVSLDGRIAGSPGRRTALTSAPANRRTQRLRATVDAIGVGSGTVLADDPLLTVREYYRARPLVRAVFDRRLRTPPTARLFSTLTDGPVIILTGVEALAGAPERARELEDAGATIVPTGGRLREAIVRLRDWDVSSVLLEGGGALHAAAWDARLIDRLCLVVAPRVLGPGGVRVFDGHATDRAAFSPDRVEVLGPDVWMEADVYGHR
jgi:diaminohydroxyphosphoribosylaminopyrimidine deaminase/5-amino-6-(5-phosphoribosylamino)uracil reductase